MPPNSAPGSPPSSPALRVPSGLAPPDGHAPGAAVARDAVPLSPFVVGCLGLLGLCAGVAAVQAAFRATTPGYGAVVLLCTLGLAALLARPLVGALRGIRQQRVLARKPDALAVDTHGVAARCDGRAPFRYAWSQVRRLDAGAGDSAGWLRLWLVDGVPEPPRLPASRRTPEGALLVLRFGDGAERPAVAEAVRRYAPPGVRTRL
ncbi:hypothetical protein [Streptomyces sp. JJ36]|uniref:hypothetical protein n=1 Tax=Streptomyces sp. JJ36 TaxID=2736645 RepID=UPI001F3B4C54|nr:hypothetical protein [Streptomyces sp. JJ36]MCF6525054.1 hypothetical protein [Streptomyces sp. JJ36]